MLKMQRKPTIFMQAQKAFKNYLKIGVAFRPTVNNFTMDIVPWKIIFLKKEP